MLPNLDNPETRRAFLKQSTGLGLASLSLSMPNANAEESDAPTLFLKNPKATWIRPAVVTLGEGNHAVRSDRWRYIRYRTREEELYDHQNDPHEWRNLADDQSLAGVKQLLAGQLPKVNAEPIQVKRKK